MTDVNDGTEPQEVEIDLFANGFDDSSLMDEVTEAGPDQSDLEKPVAEDDSDDKLPEKYRGKSINDIIEMHQNLEKAYGRHNNELGDLRKTMDTYLQHQLGGKSTTEQPATDELDPDKLLENPTAAINGAVEANPKLREIEQKLAARERADAKAAFNRDYPKAKETINDPRFLSWVEANPTRVKLLQQANDSYDFSLAGEILDTYTALVGEQATTTQAAKNTMTNAKPSAGGKPGQKKPIFTRKQLAKLQIEDPARYEKLQPQIMEAYADKRVR